MTVSDREINRQQRLVLRVWREAARQLRRTEGTKFQVWSHLSQPRLGTSRGIHPMVRVWYGGSLNFNRRGEGGVGTATHFAVSIPIQTDRLFNIPQDPHRLKSDPVIREGVTPPVAAIIDRLPHSVPLGRLVWAEVHTGSWGLNSDEPQRFGDVELRAAVPGHAPSTELALLTSTVSRLLAAAQDLQNALRV